jgi:hypothetical protein
MYFSSPALSLQTFEAEVAIVTIECERQMLDHINTCDGRLNK